MVEVVYALPGNATIISLNINKGATVRDAVEQSGLLKQFPQIDLVRNKVGIFSKPVSASRILNDGDRVEIYRPLEVDPKEARRRRAGKIRNGV